MGYLQRLAFWVDCYFTLIKSGKIENCTGLGKMWQSCCCPGSQAVNSGLGRSETDENHMTRNLHNRRILITGASSGIGRLLAEQLAQQGARLALAARPEDKLQEIASQLKTAGDVLVVPTDVARSEDRQRLLDRVVERFGGLDVLINNA